MTAPYANPYPHQQPGIQQNQAEPPVGKPLFGAKFMQATKRFFRGYVVFNGRASRSEFWWAYLAVSLLSFVAASIYVIGLIITLSANLSTASAAQLDDASMASVMLAAFAWGLPLLIFAFGTMLPMYAITWRRLHDAGFSGAFALLNLVSLSIVPLIMCILPTSVKAVRYGPGAVPPHPGAPMPQPGQYPQQSQYPQQPYQY